MSRERRKPLLPNIVLGAAILAALYLFSIGPAYAMDTPDSESMRYKVLFVVYAPVRWGAERAEWFDAAVRWYGDLCIDLIRSLD